MLRERKTSFVWRELMGKSLIYLMGLSSIWAFLVLQNKDGLLIVYINIRKWEGMENCEDKDGNPPGIIRNNLLVDPLPHLFKFIIKRLVGWHVLPTTCIPDSCIVNIYEEGDCIPPHIDNHDFARPFCTVSFLSECRILFGSNLKIEGPGEFSGSSAIPLPVGSVLVLNGNGADIAKHCVPAVPTKRISITFRRMDESKRPVGFVPEPDLQDIQPFSYEVDKLEQSTPQTPQLVPSVNTHSSRPSAHVQSHPPIVITLDRREGGAIRERRYVNSPSGSPPIATLDDLFRKTTTLPRIYYLPLSEEQVTEKLAARGKNIKT